MKFYYAPMESITGYPLRNTQHALFGGLDKYFTPFVSANESGRFTGREGETWLRKTIQGCPLCLRF